MVENFATLEITTGGEVGAKKMNNVLSIKHLGCLTVFPASRQVAASVNVSGAFMF